jgi:hypothetical protein
MWRPADADRSHRPRWLTPPFSGCRHSGTTRSISSRRRLFRHKPIFHVCGKAKLSCFSDGFGLLQSGRQLFGPCQAADARAAQPRLSRSLCVTSVISSSLLWRCPVAVLPADRIGLHRVGAYLRLMDKTAFDASQCPVLETDTSCGNALDLGARPAFGTTRPRRAARGDGVCLWIGQRCLSWGRIKAPPNPLCRRRVPMIGRRCRLGITAL